MLAAAQWFVKVFSGCLRVRRRIRQADSVRWPGAVIGSAPLVLETSERHELVLAGRIMAATVPGAGSASQVGRQGRRGAFAGRRAASAWRFPCLAARRRATEGARPASAMISA